MKILSKNAIVAIGLLLIIAVLSYLVFKDGIDPTESRTVFQVKMGKENVFRKDLDKLFERTRQVVGLPEKLYIQDALTINFNKEGSITAVDATLCGKREDGRIKMYVLSYDKKVSDNMTITVKKVENAIVTDYKLIDPLFATLSKMKIEDLISDWKEEEYGILYRGYRSFGYNTTGIVYVDHKGRTKEAESANSELAGYFVSVYVPGKEVKYQPYRYQLVENLNEIPAENDKTSMESASKLESADNK